MKKICLLLALAWCGPALAQPEGFSPTHPFGIKGLERQQNPANDPHPGQYYNWGYGYYDYYYGPYGVYHNGTVTPYPSQGSARYKDPIPQRESYPTLPSYSQPVESKAPPGY